MDNVLTECHILADERQTARKNKMFDHADFCRDEIEYRGYTIHETGYEYTLIKIPEQKIVVNVPPKQITKFNLFISKCDMVPDINRFSDLRDDDGYDAAQCWYYQETRGTCLPCNDIESWAKAVTGKKCINITISLWADAVKEGTDTKDAIKEYVKEEKLPSWVWDTFLGELYK